MALSYDDAMDELMNTDLWMDAWFVAAGYLAPRLANNLFSPLPGEVYGVASFLTGEAINQRGMTLGGGLYTVERAADRFGVDAGTVTWGGGLRWPNLWSLPKARPAITSPPSPTRADSSTQC